MVAGVFGVNGLVAPRLVEQGQEAEPENVTTQLQLMGENTVRDQIMSQMIVTQTLVQVDITSTAKQVLGNCERMELASLLGNRLSTFTF